MLAKTTSVALIGTEARLVELELHIAGSGLPVFRIVGLPTKSVTEAEQRVRSAIEATGSSWPNRRVTANLAPGGLRKEGSHFDLALAMGVLGAGDVLPTDALSEWVMVGELALDGHVRPVRGALAAAIECRRAGRRGVVCPAANGPEVALVDGIEVVPVQKLQQCIAFFGGEWLPDRVEAASPVDDDVAEDLRDVRGQQGGKRALEIAAAGAHNLLLKGPPGSGKTMLASRMPGILPPMTTDESLEVTRIHSVAGLLAERPCLIATRPFRAPHHHVSMAGLIGGGAGLPRPGEVSLAHNGTLFLDELSMYRRDVLEALRGPLEDHRVRIARSGGAITFPCRISLIAAMNPCPCGFRGDGGKECSCSEHDLQRYQARLSGPLLDRIDLQVRVDRLGKEQLLGPATGEASHQVRARVARARELQRTRYGKDGAANASVPKAVLHSALRLTEPARAMVGLAIDAMVLTGRGVDRVLRVARTVADLAGCSRVEEIHVTEALHLRVAGAKGEAASCTVA